MYKADLFGVSLLWTAAIILCALKPVLARPISQHEVTLDKYQEPNFGKSWTQKVNPWQKWSYSSPLVIALSAGILIAGVASLACCGCAACTSKGAVHPELYAKHTREIQQGIAELKRPGVKPDVHKVAQKLYDIGVRHDTALRAVHTMEEMAKLNVTENDFKQIGGKEDLIEHIKAIDRKQTIANKKNDSIASSGRPLPPRPLPQPPISGRPLPKIGQAPGKSAQPTGLDKTADFDDYTIYDQGQLNEYGIHKEEKNRKVEGGAGLDVGADFEDYTIYDEGMLNEYGLMKDMPKKKLEGAAGLDNNADFDDYTIYDEGHLNEYGVLKEQQRTAAKPEGAAGLESSADFDDYTIYDQGNLNEYGVLKAERERKMETSNMTGSGRPLATLPAAAAAALSSAAAILADAAALSSAAAYTAASKNIVIKEQGPSQFESNFDDYTIYDEGPLNEYGLVKEGLIPPKRATEGAAGLDQNADFDDYTIYDQGELNEYGLLKDARMTPRDGGAGLDENADFDDYTIYDEGALNEYGVLKEQMRQNREGGVGLDTAADFDDYTIYDNSPCAQKQEKPNTLAPVHRPGRRKVKQRTRIRRRKGPGSVSLEQDQMVPQRNTLPAIQSQIQQNFQDYLVADVNGTSEDAETNNDDG